jgi:hypothetical protein
MTYQYIPNNVCLNKCVKNKKLYFKNNNAPGTLVHSSGLGEMRGYPTPLQFFPDQEPLNVSENTNLRQMYKRTYWNDYNNINKKQIGNSKNDTSSRLNSIKSKNIGKYVYKVGLPENALISTKVYTPSIIKTTLNRVRNNI